MREIPRRVELSIGVSDIVALLGPRRSGKTFTMLKTVDKLLKSGDQALYASFEEPSLRRIDARRLDEMAREEYPSGKVHLFLDEIQEWKEWDSEIRWLHDAKDFYLYVTGSSSVLQSSEIPSKLRGRYISKMVLSLSFGEIASASVRLSGTITFRERGALVRLLIDYMSWGDARGMELQVQGEGRLHT